MCVREIVRVREKERGVIERDRERELDREIKS